jgi:phosphoribosylformylglycinamidine synthase subunit PurL
MPGKELTRKRPVPFPLFEIDIFSATPEELKEMSKAMGLNLSPEEMEAVKAYFKKAKRLPTDIELQSIAQAWSEHCCYKSSKCFLREHIFTIKHPDVLAKGDAGVMAFDDEHAYALRIESHNHPSAIEPYGGAATGIGGIVRDVLAMGAQPIALVDPLFFGPLELREVPAGVKLPKYLTGGVVAGIRDYGNRIGIPTVAGGVFFDPAYTGNCLVNVGCIGFLRRDKLLNNAVRGTGDVLILVGGHTGRDGIHGVTFASAELSARSEDESRGSVQLGDPIMKEPTIHACLEVNDRGLVSGIKDLGGGGLSCVVGEIALAGGCGAVVQLDKVPLKESGLAPWEIWVSESQERMMLAAPEENVERILEIFDLWDVPATVIAKVVKEQHVKLMYEGVEVFDLDLEFLTKGPEYCRPTAASNGRGKVPYQAPQLPDGLNSVVLSTLADPNIASKDWMITQYDHEVRGSTVIKPLQGKPGLRGPADATVLKPLVDSYRGLAIAIGVNPWFTAQDPYNGGRSSVDEACRNIVAVGGRPHALTDCLNFGNPEKPERLFEFKEAVRGIGEMARDLNLAVPSGNVSFYNETAHGAALPTPTVLGVGIVEDIRKCVTTDFKTEGNPVYLVGETKDEMGASALSRRYGGSGGQVPTVDSAALSSRTDLLLGAMSKGLVRSCHDCSDGGLVITLAEMCLGGDLGFYGDLYPLGDLPFEVKLFSESNSRFVVEVELAKTAEFEALAKEQAYRIGTVGRGRMTVRDGKAGIDLKVPAMRKAWSEPLWRLLG